MENELTSEELAREILAIFSRDRNFQPGLSLFFNTIQYNWSHWSAHDFTRGKEYALDMKWLVVIDEQHPAIQITEEGFNQATQAKGDK